MINSLIDLKSSILISLALVFPFVVMEIVNRRNLHEEFPFMLFFILWLILLPIVQGRRAAKQDQASTAPVQGNKLLTDPRSAALIGILLFQSPIILFWLNSPGWFSLDRLFNGPNPEVAYLPGQVFSLLIISIPILAGIVAGRPIVSTLRAGGSPFAHPLNLIIVAVILFLFAASSISLIADQWLCFLGVPNCD